MEMELDRTSSSTAFLTRWISMALGWVLALTARGYFPVKRPCAFVTYSTEHNTHGHGDDRPGSWFMHQSS
jgi:hypothetical protein